MRIVVYDNATHRAERETFIDIDGSGAGTTFAISHQNSAGPPVADNRDSSRRWTLSHVSLDRCWLSDVSMPTSFLAMPGPATAVVTDGSVAGSRSPARRATATFPARSSASRACTCCPMTRR
ncbi:MAG: hypothetical protein R2719_05095 [Micropruina sp.]